jgi:histone H3/H4
MEQPTQPTGQQQNRQQPVYDTRNGGHYGASAALSAQGYAPVAELYTGTWSNVNQGLQGNSRDILTTYWQQVINHLESENHDYKIHQLPLARIKKVMKADPEVKMISAEAPILFAKGCDIFITELTMRAWIHAEDNKRRTLQRSDIAAALAKSDMFDFLIDIVPREEATSHAKRSGQPGVAPPTAPAPPAGHISANQAGVQHPQHHLGAPEYALSQHPIPQDQDYRNQPGMYPGAVQSDPGAYGQPQPQMFDGMYTAYSHLPTQQ